MAKINKRLLWATADDGEDMLCLAILQQQSNSISRTNKLFVSSSKPAFQENCIKQLSAPAERPRNKIYYNNLVTLKLLLFTNQSESNIITMSFFHGSFGSP